MTDDELVDEESSEASRLNFEPYAAPQKLRISQRTGRAIGVEYSYEALKCPKDNIDATDGHFVLAPNFNWYLYAKKSRFNPKPRQAGGGIFRYEFDVIPLSDSSCHVEMIDKRNEANFFHFDLNDVSAREVLAQIDRFPVPDDIEDRIDASVGKAAQRDRFAGFPKKVRSALESSLHDGEEIQTWVQGNSQQVMVLTIDRLIVIKPGFMAGNALGVTTTGFYLRDITALEFVKKFGTSRLVVRAAGMSTANPELFGGKSEDPYALPNVIPINNDATAAKFATAVAKARSDIHSAERQPVAPVVLQTELSMAEQIRQLKELHDAGVLSDEEFSAGKAKLLG